MVNINHDKKRSRMVLFYKTASVLFPLVLFLFIFIIQANATTYYVAKIGNDSNPGTEVLPWLTIQKAANTLIAGDTVFIRTGIYNEQVIPQNSGSPGNYIVYTVYSGDTITIDGTGISLPEIWIDVNLVKAGLFHILGKSFIKISGFRIIESDGSGIFAYNNPSHIIIENNYTYNTRYSGIGVYDGNNIIIDGNEVELANIAGTWTQENISVVNIDTFEVKNNEVHHAGAQESINAKEGSKNGKIHHNYLHDANSIAIYVDGGHLHTHNIDVYQNIIYNHGTAIALSCEGGGLLENIKVYDNIAYQNTSCGIKITNWTWDSTILNHPIKNIKIINNTFYNNGNPWGGGIFVEDNPDIDSVVIRNNICSQNLSFQIVIHNTPQNLIVDHNLIDGFRGYPGEIYGSDSVVGNPMFVDTAGADFHLLAGSPAIDAGSSIDAPNFDFDGNSRPQGAGFDIGAFEYQEVGVEEDYKGSVYPNPCRVYMREKFITFRNISFGDIIKVYNISGKLVYNSGNINTNSCRWNVDNIFSGVYFYKLIGSERYRGKIIIIR